MPRNKQIKTLQVLRAVAALAVVLHHFCAEYALPWGKHLGNGGVVLFFVLSGFIIPLSVHGDSALQFLRRRAERVVPLYWLFTTVKLLANLALPFTKGVGTLSFVVLSYLMLPVTNSTGEHQPLLVTGWTLTFEAMFYLMVAVAMMLRKSAGMGVALALALAVAVVAPNMGMAPLYACFAAGLLIVFAQQHIEAMPVWAGSCLALAGLVGVFVAGPHLPASIACAMACIAGSLAIEDAVAKRIPRFLTLLGDSSYSLYLSHLLVLMPARLISRKLALGSAAACVLFVAMALSVALLSYFFVELPFMSFFRRRRTPVHGLQLVPAAS